MTNVLYAAFQYIPRRCHVVKFAKAYNVTPCLAAKSVRSTVYNKNNSESKTDPRGTEHVTYFMEDEAPVCAPSYV